MKMKDQLCKAFCDEVRVRDVPAGLAVRTAFDGLGGDPVGFYIVRNAVGAYRIEDDGGTIAFLEACGFDRDSQNRADALAGLLQSYGVEIDEATRELRTPSLAEDQVPGAALRFAALCLRMQDLLLLSAERIASTFREDAARMIKIALEGRATIAEDEPLAPALAEFPADMVIRADGRAPVVVFLSQSEQRVYEALLYQMSALHEVRIDCAVVALLEEGGTISRKMRQRAANRLAAVPEFRGDENAAVARIVQEVLGRMSRQQAMLH